MHTSTEMELPKVECIYFNKNEIQIQKSKRQKGKRKEEEKNIKNEFKLKTEWTNAVSSIVIQATVYCVHVKLNKTVSFWGRSLNKLQTARSFCGNKPGVQIFQHQ